MKRESNTFSGGWWFDTVFNCLLVPGLVSFPLIEAGLLPRSVAGVFSVIGLTVLMRVSVLDRGLA